MPVAARTAQAYSHPHAGGPAAANAQSKPKLYNPRHPERTLLYQTIAEHFETWHELASAGQFDGQGDHHTPRPFVRHTFRKYLECGIFAHGFARAWCDDCGRAASGDYFVAYSCKGRGVCPSCNTRRMVETAAHLTDHVFPRLPVRQWVLSVPKRLRYFMQRDGAVLNMVLRIFLRVIAQSLQTHSHMARGGMGGGAGSGAYNQGWGQGGAMHSGAASARLTGGNGIFGTEIARKQEPAHGFKVKQKVFHAKFGEGTVLTLEGSGDDARAQISFPRHGTKWLALSIAKLTPI